MTAFCETSLSLTSICKLASQWRTIHYLVCPMEVLKSLKFLPLISKLGAYADDIAHAHVNLLLR